MRLARSLLLGVAAATLLAASAQAADFMADPIYDSPMFNFEGFYVGVTGGGASVPGPGFVGSAGVVAGANFALTDAFLAGVEFQGDALFNGTGYVGYDALLLAHLGGYVTQDMVVYAAGGAGLVNGAGSYAFGAGIEAPLMDHVSGRAEILATGPWGAMPNGGRGTIGLLWHMN